MSRKVEVFPATIADTLQAHWYEGSHLLEVVGHDDYVMAHVDMVMSPEHARQVLDVVLGEVGKHVSLDVE